MCVAQIDNQDGAEPKKSLGKFYLLLANLIPLCQVSLFY